ncbi:MAG: hypothetical protein ACE5IR_08705 [bacterium]
MGFVSPGCHRLCFPGFFVFVVLLISNSFSQEMPYQTRPPEKNERCLVCGVALTPDDIVLIVRGRRVPLNQAMVDSFLNNQEEYFAKLQPKSALFQENLQAPLGSSQGGMSLGWFLFGAYILIALTFSGLSGNAAIVKGLPPIPHFFIGFFFSLFGYLYVLTRPEAADKGHIPKGLTKVPVTKAPIVCPQCGNTNHPTATGCLQCKAQLEPAWESEINRAD